MNGLEDVSRVSATQEQNVCWNLWREILSETDWWAISYRIEKGRFGPQSRSCHSIYLREGEKRDELGAQDLTSNCLVAEVHFRILTPHVVVSKRIFDAGV